MVIVYNCFILRIDVGGSVKRANMFIGVRYCFNQTCSTVLIVKLN